MHNMKKSHLIILIVTIIVTCAAVTGILLFGFKTKNDDFYTISFYEILTIIIDLVVGIFVALMILFLSITHDVQRNKKELLVRYLQKIEDKIEESDRLTVKTKLQPFWDNSLITKKYIDSIFRIIKNTKTLDKYETTLLNEAIRCFNEYCSFIENHMYSKAIINYLLITREANLREMFKYKITHLIFAIS